MLPDNVFAALQQERAKYGTPMTNDQCVDLLNTVAYQFASAGWGLYKKPSGNNGIRSDGTPCSVDFLVLSPSAAGFDVFTDAGGATTPQRGGEPELMDLSRWVAPIPPAASEPAPTPTPTPTPVPAPTPAPDRTADVLEAIAALSRKVDEMRQQSDARAVAIVMGIGQALDKLDRPYTGSIKYLGAFTITPKDAA